MPFVTLCRNSESESSAQSTPPVKKKAPVGRKPGKKQSRNSASTSKSDQSKDQGNSESDVDMKPVTRSSNTRKSKHLTGMCVLESSPRMNNLLIFIYYCCCSNLQSIKSVRSIGIGNGWKAIKESCETYKRKGK